MKRTMQTRASILFHGVFPSTPAVGDSITLGTGLLATGRNSSGGIQVGLTPFDDDRTTMWLDIHALYRCHEQTVDLMYEPLEESLTSKPGVSKPSDGLDRRAPHA